MGHDQDDRNCDQKVECRNNAGRCQGHALGAGPDQVDTMKLVQPALKAGIAFNPGPEWAVDGAAAKSRLRLCFGLTTKEEIRDGVAAFAKVCYEETGIPEQSGNIRHATQRPGS